MIGPGHVVGHFSPPPPTEPCFDVHVWYIKQSEEQLSFISEQLIEVVDGGRVVSEKLCYVILCLFSNLTCFGLPSWAPHKGYMPHLLFYKLYFKTIKYWLMIVLCLLDLKLPTLLRYTRYTCVLSNSCFISASSWSPKTPCDNIPPAHSFPIFPAYYRFETQLMGMLRCFTSEH